jgi:hypothetical protein
MRFVDAEDEGSVSKAELLELLSQDLAAAATQLNLTDSSSQRTTEVSRPAPALAPVSQATADLLAGGEPVDWEQHEPEAVAAALRASGGWSRVIRAPRKRSGHVLLDLCAAAPPAPPAAAATSAQQESQPAAAGVLLKQVVSRAAARRDAGGTAAYRLARRLRWGDAWPHHYQQLFRAWQPPTERT